MRSLIVEDDHVSRRLLQTYLTPHGPCESAENATEAVQMFQRARENGQPFDMICLDILMPGIHGLQMLEAIREQELRSGVTEEEAVKVIMTTVLGDEATITQAFQTGCEAFIVKPIQREELFHAINNLGLLRQPTPIAQEPARGETPPHSGPS